jgi:hypothetical protein
MNGSPQAERTRGLVTPAVVGSVGTSDGWMASCAFDKNLRLLRTRSTSEKCRRQRPSSCLGVLEDRLALLDERGHS